MAGSTRLPRVLVVDDSAVDRRLAGGLLERAGTLAVEYASDGDEALQRVQNELPDIVVYTEALGPAAYIGRARVVPLRNTGAALSPFNAFLILQGIETLALRLDREILDAVARSRVPSTRRESLQNSRRAARPVTNAGLKPRKVPLCSPGHHTSSSRRMSSKANGKP